MFKCPRGNRYINVCVGQYKYIYIYIYIYIILLDTIHMTIFWNKIICKKAYFLEKKKKNDICWNFDKIKFEIAKPHV